MRNSLLRATRLVAENGLYEPSSVTGGGGGGITQLTGQVTATGPGIVPATVAAEQEQVLWVGPAGNDLTGNGNLFNPYATYAKSAAVAVAAGASSTKIYTVMFFSGNYAENIALVPFVNILGVDPSGTTFLNGTMTLDPSFSGAGSFCFVSNATQEGATTFDFSSVGSHDGSVSTTNVTFEGPFSVTGDGAGNTNEVFLTLGGLADFAGCTITDAELGTSGTTLDTSLTFVANLAAAGWQGFAGDELTGSLTITGLGAFLCDVALLGTTLNGPVALHGPNAKLQGTIQSFGTSLVLTGGATPPIMIGSGGGSLGAVLTADGAGNMNWSTSFLYSPAVPGNWAGAPPTTVNQALDRIAANTTNTHPIP